MNLLGYHLLCPTERRICELDIKFGGKVETTSIALKTIGFGMIRQYKS